LVFHARRTLAFLSRPSPHCSPANGCGPYSVISFFLSPVDGFFLTVPFLLLFAVGESERRSFPVVAGPSRSSPFFSPTSPPHRRNLFLFLSGRLGRVKTVTRFFSEPFPEDAFFPLNSPFLLCR